MDREEINRRFCAHIGAEYGAPYEPPGTWPERMRRFEVLGEPGPRAKRPDYLLVRKSGNFGNNYIQLVHALAAAEAAGVRRVLHRFGQFGAHRPSAGPRLVARRRLPGKTGLAGTFFLRKTVASLADMPPERFLRVSDNFVQPALLMPTPAPEPGVVALNLRGGADVFENAAPNRGYGQPPLSYYQAAVEALEARGDVREVNLVHQDRLNPVLAPLIDWLERRGAPWRLTSGSMLGDASALMAAEHVVMGWTTFTSALCLLSPHVRTVTVFRRAPLINELAAASERLYVIEDAEGDYEPANAWLNTPAQLAMMRDYPGERLTWREATAKRRSTAERFAGYRLRRNARYARLFGR